MFLRKPITKSTKTFSQNVTELSNTIKNADAVIIGAGAGMSAAAGFEYGGERFKKYFADFKEKYGFSDMYTGGFYPYASEEEFWAFWSRNIYINRYLDIPNDAYALLFSLIKDKDYFVITTNVDHCFQKSGFDKKRLFYTQGDYGLFQCATPCCDKTFDNKEIVVNMVNAQKDMKIPTKLIPRCPVCGGKMTTNLRCDDKFVQDEGWHKAAQRYDNFLRTRKGQRTLFLELGVGYNTPAIIKYPFWQMTAQNPKATYACLNSGEASFPSEIASQSICVEGNIYYTLKELSKLK